MTQVQKIQFQNTNLEPVNRAFLYGDSVSAHFFVRNSKLIMAEESYFFLMASMRKMRMNIPLTYTLEFFENLLVQNNLSAGFSNGIIEVKAYRNNDSEKPLPKAKVELYFSATALDDVLSIRKKISMDMMKEITVSDSFLSNIRVPSPENIYAEIYASENELDDLLLLNPRKKIARTICGNLLLLTENKIRIPKQSEGAYISPLLENFVTFLHKNALAEIVEDEIVAFETQKAEEILVVSDSEGIFSVEKIRNKKFPADQFTNLLAQWKESFAEPT